METVLLVIQIIVIISMIIAILLQPSSSDGLSGLGGGGSAGGSGLFSSRGSANFMTKTTAILATVFMFNSLLLASITARENQKGSIIDQYTAEKIIETTTEEQAPAEDAEPVVPLAE